MLPSSDEEPGGTPVSICLGYHKLVEEGDRLNIDSPFLSSVLFSSTGCNSKHFDLGTWCSGVEGKQSFCHPSPYAGVTQQELLELTLQLLRDFCPDGEMCRNDVQDMWGWLKRSSKQCPLQRL